jgi:phage head maturation protease
MPQPEETLELKTLGALEIKSEAEGRVEAVIATLNVVDKDADVLADGALKNGAKVKLSSYGHDAVFGDMPVGKGAVFVEGDKAIFRGQYFLGTQRGLEAFNTIKALGTDQEWSFGFRVLKAEDPGDEWRAKGARRVLTKLAAFEVSPVIIGAGVGTGTVDVKEAEAAAAAQAAVDAEAARAREEEAKAVALAAVNAEGAKLFARARPLLGRKS